MLKKTPENYVPCYAYVTHPADINKIRDAPRGVGVSLFYTFEHIRIDALGTDLQHLLKAGQLVCYMHNDRIVQLGNARNIPLEWRMLSLSDFIKEVAFDAPENAPASVSYTMVETGLCWEVIKEHLMSTDHSNDIFSIMARAPYSLDDIKINLAPGEPKLIVSSEQSLCFMSVKELVDFVDGSGVNLDDVIAEIDLVFPALSMCPPVITLSYENKNNGVIINNAYAR